MWLKRFTDDLAVLDTFPSGGVGSTTLRATCPPCGVERRLGPVAAEHGITGIPRRGVTGQLHSETLVRRTIQMYAGVGTGPVGSTAHRADRVGRNRGRAGVVDEHAVPGAAGCDSVGMTGCRHAAHASLPVKPPRLES
jgi:hypothetical protein